jgi:fructose-1-phosphate kinase PfkB-like protein
MSVVDERDGSVTDLNEPAAPWAESTWRAWEQVLGGIAPTWIVVSGAIAAADAPRLALTLTEAKSRGARVAIDTHGDALRTLLAEVRVDLVKVNEEEASAICGPRDLVDLATELRERGAGVAVVTAGARGSVAAQEAHPTIRVTRNPRGGRYTNGCGDSAMAGIVRAVSRGEDLSVALASGTAAAVANTRQPGAAVFSRSDYAQALAEVEIA